MLKLISGPAIGAGRLSLHFLRRRVVVEFAHVMCPPELGVGVLQRGLLRSLGAVGSAVPILPARPSARW